MTVRNGQCWLAWLAICFAHCSFALADAQQELPAWRVVDIEPGMKGHGVTVIQGTRPEQFDVQIIGVLKNYNPGLDLILARLSGLELEKTGVAAGMSGSPVYVNQKLVGAVAYTWPFGKEPIAGITPYEQMVANSQFSVRGKTNVAASHSYLLDAPLEVSSRLGGVVPERIDVGQLVTGPAGVDCLVPIRTPIVTSGVSAAALEELGNQLATWELIPVAGGAADEHIKRQHAAARLEPGSAMAVGLVTGDVSMTAIGTTTAIVGKRVFGFGHPFSGIGACDLPLMSAYIHMIMPLQSVSSKMGSALVPIGRIDTDASTCVAGWLGESSDMLPVSIRVQNRLAASERTFRCQVVRERTLLPSLALSTLASCAEVEASAPDELTAKLSANISIKGHPPLKYESMFSGPRYTGSRGLLMVYMEIARVLDLLSNNPFARPKILSVDCATELIPRRNSASIVHASVDNEILEAGEMLNVVVTIQPYLPDGRGDRASEFIKIPMTLPLPKHLPPGKYTATVSDAAFDFRNAMRNRRHVASPTNFEQLYEFLKLQLELDRTRVVLRFNLPALGLAVAGTELPNLPSAVADILARDGTQPATRLVSSVVSHQDTGLVTEGSESIRFEVVERKEFYRP